MAYLPIKDPHEYKADIREIEITDKGHPNTFNPQYETLINNDAYLKDRLDQAVSHYTVTVPANWTGSSPAYHQTIAVPGIRSTDVPIIDIVAEWDSVSDLAVVATRAKAWGCVDKVVTGDNCIVLYCCKKKPTIPFKLQIKVVR